MSGGSDAHMSLEEMINADKNANLEMSGGAAKKKNSRSKSKTKATKKSKSKTKATKRSKSK